MKASSANVGRASRSDLIILGLFLVAFALGNVWLAQRGAREASGLEMFPNASAFNGGPSGVRGLYFFWRRLGYDVRVWRRDYDMLPHDAAMLVVATPFPPFGFAEPGAGGEEPTLKGRDLIRWARSGHTVLLLGMENGLTAVAGAGLRGGGAAPARLPAGGQGESGATRASQSSKRPGASGSSQRGALSPAAPTGLMEGVKALSVAGDRWEGMREPVVVHAGDGRRPVLISRAVGRGQVIALADSSALANRHLAERDNVILAANLAALAGGPIYFDEYHHGMRERRSLAALLFRPPALWVTLQVLLVAALLFHAASRRFGPVIPLRTVPRYRASVEYVAAMATLYQRAGARAVVLDRLAAGFRREVGRALGLPPGAPAEQIGRMAERRVGVDGARILRILRLCEEQASGGSKPKEGLLLSAGAELETMRRQVLRIGRQPRAGS